MHHLLGRASTFALIMSTALLSACGDASKDEAMARIFTECQLNAHTSMENSPLAGEQRRFAIGAYVEECFKGSGLQPLDTARDDATCFEAPQPGEDAKGFIKPLQKCWKNPKSSKN